MHCSDGRLMPTYMLGPGGLEPVVHQDDVPDGFGEEWCALVRPQVLELTDTPAFAVAWDADRPPLLTAMSAEGEVCTAAVLPRLDLVTLAELIARAGRARVASWAQVARRYPRGAAAFRRDWNAFRESASGSAVHGAALTVVTGTVSEEVAWSMPLLEQVRIVQARVRRGRRGKYLLDLDPLDAATVPHRADATTPAASAAAPLAATVPEERRSRGGSAQQPSAGDPSPPVEGRRQPGAAEKSAAAQRPAGDARSAAEDARRPAEQRRPRARRAAAPDAVTAATPAAPDGLAEPDDREALGLVAALVQAPAAIELHHNEVRHRATLHSAGEIVLPDGTRYSDLRRACVELIGADHPDPWLMWRFTDGQFPLAEARAEALRHRERRRVARNGSTTRRRVQN